MLDNLEIRQMEISEVKECFEIFADRYSKQTLKDYPELIDTFKKDSMKTISDTCEALEYGTMSGNVATIDNKIVGFVLVTEPNYIRKIAVKKEYQNLGIAKKLIESTEKENTELVVHAAEKVIPFYEKLGFVKDGEMNREKYPYLPMKKYLRDRYKTFER